MKNKIFDIVFNIKYNLMQIQPDYDENGDKFISVNENEKTNEIYFLLIELKGLLPSLFNDITNCIWLENKDKFILIDETIKICDDVMAIIP